MKVTLCGNCGSRTGQLDGQTFRTRLVHEELAKRLGAESVQMIDTSFMVTRPIRTLWSLKRGYDACDLLIAMPGSNGLYVFSRFLDRWRRKQRKPVHYMVVGGWLPEYLERHRRILEFCSRLDGMYVQTRSMVAKLTALGLSNVHMLPNFRHFDRRPLIRTQQYESDGPPLKACFYSRVTKAKGVEIAMEACRRVNMRAGKTIVTLHIFGPITNEYAREFAQLRRRFPEHEYRGVLAADNPYTTLHKYDVMLFPTCYGGEGFPGAVLDAFIAGLPVIASDWRYNNEVVEDGKTGMLFPVHQIDKLEECLHRMVDDPAMVRDMKRNVLEEARRYHTDEVFPALLAHMKRSIKIDSVLSRAIAGRPQGTTV